MAKIAHKTPEKCAIFHIIIFSDITTAVEYSSRWVREGLIHVGHVDFMLFVHLFPRWVGENYPTFSHVIWALKYKSYYTLK